MWMVFCAHKNELLKKHRERFSLNFEICIEEIKKGDFLVIDSPGNKNHGQKSFLLEIHGYPIIVPFNIRGRVIQLVTIFPDRRYKNDQNK